MCQCCIHPSRQFLASFTAVVTAAWLPKSHIYLIFLVVNGNTFSVRVSEGQLSSKREQSFDPATSGMTLAAPPLLSLFLIFQRSNRWLVKLSVGFRLLGVGKDEGACSAGLHRSGKQFQISHWQQKIIYGQLVWVLDNVSTLFLIPIPSTAHFRSRLWLLYSKSMFNDLFSGNAQLRKFLKKKVFHCQCGTCCVSFGLKVRYL